MAIYNIAATGLSPDDVMDALAAGMNAMLPPPGTRERPVIEGTFMFQIRVDDAYAEIVEEAARRQGVKLIKVDEDDDVIREDVEFAGADTEVPDDDDEDD